MATAKHQKPLTGSEEAFWRSFVRALVVVPRILDTELLDGQRLGANEYIVLVLLSEAEGRQLRMSALAELTSLTVSGIARIVKRLSADGLVERVRSSEDGRGAFAVLTPGGLARLKEAYPTHLAGARLHVINHLQGFNLEELARAFSLMADEEPFSQD